MNYIKKLSRFFFGAGALFWSNSVDAADITISQVEPYTDPLSYTANNQTININSSLDVATGAAISSSTYTGLKLNINTGNAATGVVATGSYGALEITSLSSLSQFILSSGLMTSAYDGGATVLLAGQSRNTFMSLASGTTLSNTSSSGYAINSNSTYNNNLQISNEGTISADSAAGTAINFNDSNGGSTLTLTNTGTISAGTAINAESTSSGTNVVSLINDGSGAINGDLYANNNQFQLQNFSSATVTGNIDLGSNSNSYVDLEGGSITGDINMGHYNQLVLFNGGSIDGDISGAGRVQFSDNYTLLGNIGGDTEVTSITVDAGKVLNVGTLSIATSNNSSVNYDDGIFLGSGAVLNLGTGVMNSTIDGLSSNQGSVNVAGNNTFSYAIGSDNSISSLNVYDNVTLTMNNDINASTVTIGSVEGGSAASLILGDTRTLTGAVDVRVNSTLTLNGSASVSGSVTLNSGSVLNVNNGNISGDVLGASDVVGNVNFLDNYTLSNDFGSSTNSLNSVSVAAGKTLTVGSNVIDATTINLNSGSTIKLSADTVNGSILATSDGVGNVDFEASLSLSQNLGSADYSLNSVNVANSTTLSLGSYSVDATTVNIGSSATLNLGSGTIVGSVDGTSANNGTFNINGSGSVTGSIGANNGLYALNISDGNSLNAAGSIKALTTTVGSGEGGGNFELATTKTLTGDLVLNTGSAATFNGTSYVDGGVTLYSGSFLNLGTGSVTGTILGNVDNVGTVNFNDDYSTSNNIGDADHSIAALNVGSGKTLTINDGVDATAINLASGSKVILNSTDAVVADILGVVDGEGTVELTLNTTLSGDLGSSTNSLANVNIGNYTLDASTYSIDATNINLSNSSILKIGSSSINGNIDGLTSGAGTVQITAAGVSLSNDIGTTNGIAALNINDSAALNLDGNIKASNVTVGQGATGGSFTLVTGNTLTGNLTVDNNSTATLNGSASVTGTITLDDGSNLNLSSAAAYNSIVGASDGVGSVNFDSNVTLSNNIGTEAFSLYALNVGSDKTLSLGSSTVYADNIFLSSNSTFDTSVGSLFGNIDGSDTRNGVVNVTGANSSITGNIGSTNGINTLNVNDTASITVTGSINATTVNVGQGEVGGDLTVSTGNSLTGNLVLDNDSSATFEGSANVVGDVTIDSGATLELNTGAVSGTILGTTDGVGNVNFKGNLSLANNVGSETNSLANFHVFSGATVIAGSNNIDATNIVLDDGAILALGSGSVTGAIDGSATNKGILDIAANKTLSDDIGAVNGIEALNVLGGFSLTSNGSIKAATLRVGDGFEISSFDLAGSETLTGNLVINTASSADLGHSAVLNGSTTIWENASLNLGHNVSVLGNVLGASDGVGTVNVNGDLTLFYNLGDSTHSLSAVNVANYNDLAVGLNTLDAASINLGLGATINISASSVTGDVLGITDGFGTVDITGDVTLNGDLGSTSNSLDAVNISANKSLDVGSNTIDATNINLNSGSNLIIGQATINGSIDGTDAESPVGTLTVTDSVQINAAIGTTNGIYAVNINDGGELIVSEVKASTVNVGQGSGVAQFNLASSGTLDGDLVVNSGSIATIGDNGTLTGNTTLNSDGTLNLVRTATIGGTILGASDDVGELNLGGDFTLSNDIGSSTNSLSTVNVSSGKTLSVGNHILDANVINLNSGSSIEIAYSTVTGDVIGKTDGIGGANILGDVTLNGDLGNSSNSLSYVSVAADKTLNVGSNTIDATNINLNSSSIISLGSGSITGNIDGNNARYGTINAAGLLGSINGNIGAAHGIDALNVNDGASLSVYGSIDASNVTVGVGEGVAEFTLATGNSLTGNLTVNNGSSATFSGSSSINGNVTLENNANLNLNYGQVSGTVLGASDGVGNVNIDSDFTLSNSFGDSSHSLNQVNVAEATYLTVGSNILDSNSINLNSGAGIIISDSTVTGDVLGVSDGVGSVSITGDVTLNGDVGSDTNSVNSISISANKTLNVGSNLIDANNVYLNSGSNLTVTSGSITANIDGNSVESPVGTVTVYSSEGGATINGSIGSTNGIYALNINDGGSLTANADIKASTVTVGQGETSASFNLADGNELTGNLIVSSGSSATLVGDSLITGNVTLNSSSTLNYDFKIQGTIMGTSGVEGQGTGTINIGGYVEANGDIGSATNSIDTINILAGNYLGTSGYDVYASNVSLSNNAILYIDGASFNAAIDGNDAEAKVGDVRVTELSTVVNGSIGSTNGIANLLIYDNASLTSNASINATTVDVGQGGAGGSLTVSSGYGLTGGLNIKDNSTATFEGNASVTGNITLYSGSVLNLNNGTVSGTILGSGDNMGTINFNENFTMNANIGDADHTIDTVSIADGKTLTIGSYILEASKIVVGSGSALSIGSGSYDGLIDGSGADSGILNVIADTTFSQEIGTTNKLSQINVYNGVAATFDNSIIASDVTVGQGGSAASLSLNGNYGLTGDLTTNNATVYLNNYYNVTGDVTLNNSGDHIYVDDNSSISGNLNLNSGSSATFSNYAAMIGNITLDSGSSLFVNTSDAISGGNILGLNDDNGSVTFSANQGAFGNIGDAEHSLNSVLISDGVTLDLASFTLDATSINLGLNSELIVGSSITGKVTGVNDGEGTVTINGNIALNGDLGSADNSLSAVTIFYENTLNVGSNNIDATNINLDMYSNLELGSGSVTGAIDGLNAESRVGNIDITASGAVINGSIGATNGIASLYINDNASLTSNASINASNVFVGEGGAGGYLGLSSGYNLSGDLVVDTNSTATLVGSASVEGNVTLGSSATLNLNTGSVSGTILASGDNQGTVNFNDNFTLSNNLGNSSHTINTVNVNSGTLTAGSYGIDATNIDLGIGASLTLADGTVSGLIEGAIDNAGTLNLTETRTISQAIGATHSLANINVSDLANITLNSSIKAQTVTVGEGSSGSIVVSTGNTVTGDVVLVDSAVVTLSGNANIVGDVTLGDATLNINTGSVSGTILGSGDNYGIINFNDSSTLGGDVGSTDYSINKVNIAANKTITTAANDIDATNIKLASGSTLALGNSTVTGSIDGASDYTGTLNAYGTASVNGNIGSTKALSTVYVTDGGSLTVDGDIKASTIAIGQGSGTASFELLTANNLTGNVTVYNNSTATFSGSASVTGNIGVSNGATLNLNSGTVSGSIRGTGFRYGTVNFNDNFSLSNVVGTADTTLSSINIAANKTVTAGSNSVYANNINLNSGSIFNIGTGSINGTIDGTSSSVGTVVVSGNNTLSGAVGSTNGIAALNINDGVSLTLQSSSKAQTVTVGQGGSAATLNIENSASLNGDLVISNNSTANIASLSAINGETTLGNSSTLNLAESVGLGGNVLGATDGVGTVNVNGDLSLSYDLGSSSNSLSAINIAAGKTLNVSSHNLDASNINLNSGSIINIGSLEGGAGSLTGSIDGTSAYVGTINIDASGSTTSINGEIGTTNGIAALNIYDGASVTTNFDINASTVTVGQGGTGGSLNVDSGNTLTGSLLVKDNSTATLSGSASVVGNVTLYSGSVLTMNSGSVSGTILGFADNVGTINFNDSFTMSADIGDVDHTIDIVNIADGQSLTIGSYNLDVNTINLGTDSALSVGIGSYSGSIEGAGADSGILNVTDNRTFTQSIGIVNSLSRVNIYNGVTSVFEGDVAATTVSVGQGEGSASLELATENTLTGNLVINSGSTVTLNDLTTLAGNATLSGSSTLNLGDTVSVTGTILGASDGVGTLNVNGDFTMANDVGNMYYSLSSVNVGANSTLTVGSYTLDANSINLNSGSNLVMSSSTVAGDVLGVTDGVGNVSITGNLSLDGDLGSETQSLASVDIAAGKTLSVGFNNLDSLAINLNSGSTLSVSAGSITGNIDGTDAEVAVGTVNISDAATINGAIGSTNGIAALNISGGATINNSVTATSVSIQSNGVSFNGDGTLTGTTTVTDASSVDVYDSYHIAGDLNINDLIESNSTVSLHNTSSVTGDVYVGTSNSLVLNDTSSITGEVTVASGASVSLSGGSVVGDILGSNDGEGNVNVTSSSTLAGNIGSVSNSLSGLDISSDKTLSTSSYNLDVDNITLHSGSILSLGTGTINFTTIDGGDAETAQGTVEVTADTTTNGSIGSTNGILALNVNDGASLTSNGVIKANTVTVGQDGSGNAIFTLASQTGLIGDLVVKRYSTAYISSDVTGDITLGHNSYLDLDAVNIFGEIVGSSSYYGTININDNFTLSQNLGTSNKELETINLAENKTLIVGSGTSIASGFIYLSSGSTLDLSSSITAEVGGNSDGSGDVIISDNITLNGSLGYDSYSLNSVAIAAGKTLTTGAQEIQATNISLNSGSVLSLGSSSSLGTPTITGAIDGTDAESNVGTVEVAEGSINIDGNIGSINAIDSLSVKDGATLNVDGEITASNVTIGQGAGAATFELADGNTLNGNLTVNSGSTANFLGTASINGETVLGSSSILNLNASSILGSIIGSSNGDGTVNFNDNATLSSGLGSSAHSLAAINIASNVSISLADNSYINTVTVGDGEGGSLFTAGYNLTSGNINISSGGLLNVDFASTVSGVINGTSAGVGTLQYSGSGAVTQAAAIGSTNQLSEIIVGDGVTLSVNYDAIANDITVGQGEGGTLNVTGGTLGNSSSITSIGNGATLSYQSGTINGTIRGQAAGQGIFEVASDYTNSNKIGDVYSLSQLNILADKTLTLGNDVAATSVVVDGTLSMGATARTITGNVSVSDSGTIDLGTASHSVSGDLTLSSGSTLGVTIASATSAGKITASGAASNSSNGTININISESAGYIANNTKFVIVQGSGESTLTSLADSNIKVNGTDSNTYNKLSFSTSVVGDELIVGVTRAVDPTITSNSGSSQALYENINTLSGTGKLLELQSFVETASSEEAATALKEAAPQVDNSTNRNAVMVVNMSLNAAEMRMEAGRGSGVSSGDESSATGLWAKVIGSSARQSALRSGGDGFTSNAGGFTIGGDIMSDDSLVGLSGSYVSSNIKATSGNKTTNVESYQFNLYRSDNFDKIFIDTMLGFAWNSYDSSRTVSAVSANAKSSYSGQTYVAKAKIGIVENFGNLRVTPALTITGVHNTVGSYTEKGADTLNLNVKNVSNNFFETRLGVGFDYDLKVNKNTKLTPHLTVSYGRDLIGDRQSATANFVGQASSFSMTASKNYQNSLIVSTGVDLYQGDSVQFGAEYTFENKYNFQAHTGTLKARYNF